MVATINTKAEIKFDSTATVMYTKGLFLSSPEDEIIGWSLYASRPHDVARTWAKLMAKNGTAWAVGRTADGYRLAWKTVKIGRKFHGDTYRMRSVPGGYKGDRVTRFSRMINGRKIDFVRIAWNMGDDGTTVEAFTGVACKLLHRFHYPAK